MTNHLPKPATIDSDELTDLAAMAAIEGNGFGTLASLRPAVADFLKVPARSCAIPLPTMAEIEAELLAGEQS